MRTPKHFKVTAVILAVLMILPVAGVPSFAAEADSAAKETSKLESIIELLEAESYYAYHEEKVSQGWVNATADDVVIKAAEDYVYTPHPEYETKPAEVQDDAEKGKVLYTPEAGTVSWKFTAPQTGFYEIVIVYKPVESTNTASIERELSIDGKIPYKEAYYLEMTRHFIDNYNPDAKREDGGQGFDLDINGNEKKPLKEEIFVWKEYAASDSSGYIVEPLQFAIEQGEHTIELSSTMNELMIAEIIIRAPKQIPSYEEYLSANGNKDASKDAASIKVQAELTSGTSDVTIYALNDRTSSINEPQDASKALLNTTGGSKYQNIGQWIEWTIPGSQITESGYYYIVPRFKQEVRAGLYVSRRLYINGEVPFKEASYLRFQYSDDWQCTPLNDGETNFKFYFEAGKDYTIKLEVVYGSMADILRRCEASLNAMNDIYNSILKITGPTPDEYSYYGFAERIYDTIIEMRTQEAELFKVIMEFKEILGGKSASDIATLEKVVYILDKMGSSESNIAKNLENLKVNSGTLGTWIMNTKLQPLTLDYILIQPIEEELPKAKSGFWNSLVFEVQSFFASFFTDYNSLGATEDLSNDAEAVEVWIATSRDEAQVMREMIDNYCDVKVNLKLVAAGTLLPATLAGDGPDISLATGQADVINYAIRSAIEPLSQFEDYHEVTAQRFNPETLVGLRLENPDNPGTYDYYGMPERLGFSMLFYRKDIFIELGIDIPETWDDLYEIVPVLQVNYRDVGFPTSYAGLQMLMYQRDEDIYTDLDGNGVLDGMQINIDSNTSLECFEELCQLFQLFKFPRVYDLATYFRMGEMPIAVADYLTYNQFSIYATEIKGLWEFAPLPGTIQRDDDGNVILDEDGNPVINYNAPCSVSSVILMKDKSGRSEELNQNCWEFIKWWTGSFAQSEYATQYEALIGMAAKYNTANTEALQNMPWTTSEKAALQEQFQNLKGTPEFPGGYIITRYVDFAFLNCYNNNADPVDSLLDQIQYINNELSRKRKEFGLITYEDYIENGGVDIRP